jgi:hypothetical protein
MNGCHWFFFFLFYYVDNICALKEWWWQRWKKIITHTIKYACVCLKAHYVDETTRQRKSVRRRYITSYFFLSFLSKTVSSTLTCMSYSCLHVLFLLIMMMITGLFVKTGHKKRLFPLLSFFFLYDRLLSIIIE